MKDQTACALVSGIALPDQANGVGPETDEEPDSTGSEAEGGDKDDRPTVVENRVTPSPAKMKVRQAIKLLQSLKDERNADVLVSAALWFVASLVTKENNHKKN